jgi:hypothetical protein
MHSIQTEVVTVGGDKISPTFFYRTDQSDNSGVLPPLSSPVKVPSRFSSYLNYLPAEVISAKSPGEIKPWNEPLEIINLGAGWRSEIGDYHLLIPVPALLFYS